MLVCEYGVQIDTYLPRLEADSEARNLVLQLVTTCATVVNSRTVAVQHTDDGCL